MDDKHIKPIPKIIEKKIVAMDKKCCPDQKGLRFYAYLTSIEKELVKITVAVRNNKRQDRFIKQVAIHGVYSDNCLVRDLEYCYLGIYAYRVGWYDEGISRYRPFFNDGKWYPAEFKYYNPYAMVVNPEYALTKKEFKYSALEKYNPTCIITYLRTYLQYPQSEYLIKSGLEKFAESATILKKIGKDKQFAKWLLQNKDTLANNYFYIPVIIKAYKTKEPLLKTQIREELTRGNRQGNYDKFKSTFGSDFDELCTYLINKQIHLATYMDYYQACVYLGLDVSLEKHRYPHDFQRWHDIRIDKYATEKAIKDEEERKKLYAAFAQIAEKYMPLEYKNNSPYVVFIPTSPEDLVHEGDSLHHCVGRMNYDRRIIREESLIFFIRTKDKPQIPLATVEYSPSQNLVLQCYGDHDSTPKAAIVDFVKNKWLPYANKQLQQIAA